jgi:hypothetical protein
MTMLSVLWNERAPKFQDLRLWFRYAKTPYPTVPGSAGDSALLGALTYQVYLQQVPFPHAIWWASTNTTGTQGLRPEEPHIVHESKGNLRASSNGSAIQRNPGILITSIP